VNKKYVLDTSAIIAFLEEEAGADTVEELLPYK
jgi:PIN domain nuclease of toxin-antitoxin system